MRDFNGREVEVGANVLYIIKGAQTPVVVTAFENGKATLQKEDGTTSKVTWTDAKAVLIRDTVYLA